MRMPRLATWTFVLALPVTAWVVACGGGTDSTFNGNNTDQLTGDTDGGDEGGSVPHLGGNNHTDSGSNGGGGSNVDGGPQCVSGLCKQQVYCGATAHTTISGQVFNPAGTTPLYNVLVYVPNHPEQVAAITHGASCDRCGSVSGDPLVSAITDTHGKFTLTDVPVGTDIPLVIQVGKWRRQIKIPTVAKCVDTPLTDVTQTRLPKNKTEGDIPLIALTTGGADSLECFLRSSKVGLDDSEFTQPGGGGSVNLYGGVAGSAKYAPGVNAGATFPAADHPFWDDVNKLKVYDMVVLSCEGNLYEGTGGIAKSQTKNQTTYDAMYAYTSMGGRMFATHWHRGFFSEQASMAMTGTFADNGDPGDPADGLINDTFPKGQAFRDWLVNVNATPTVDHLSISAPRDNVQAVTTMATQWVSTQSGGHNVVEYMTANTPIGAADDKVCGRAVFSDLHVGGASKDKVGQPWPTGCTSVGLTPQEKALEFLLFDLSSCVQSDTKPPMPPPTGGGGGVK